MIKAVFFDIDGTLASFKTHEISVESIRTLTELRRLGIRLYIATGRHFLCIDNLGNFPFDGYICMNGAVIYNDGKIIFRKPLDRNDSQTVALVARDRHIPCAVFSENSIGMNFIDDGSREVLRMVRMPDPPIVPFPECADEPVYQYTVFADRRQEEEYLRPALKNSTVSRWFPAFMDVNPGNLSKAVAVERVISACGIRREEVMAFGDGGNDVEMIEYAGIGIAMGNAAEDVRARADYVTSTVDEEGVTAAVRHFGLIR